MLIVITCSKTTLNLQRNLNESALLRRMMNAGETYFISDYNYKWRNKNVIYKTM